MHCLIIVNPYARSSSVLEKAARLKEELTLLDCESDVRDATQLVPTLESSEFHLADETHYDFCLYLDKDKYLANLLERRMPVFNSARATELCDDKTTTFLALMGSGIQTPKTIPAPLCYTAPTGEAATRFLDRVESELEYPLVCKEAYGSLGRQVYLVENRQQLEETYQRLGRTTHLYQEFIGASTTSASDYRVITVGGKVITSMRRVNDHDFRSNLGNGGHALPVTSLDPAIATMAEQCSKLLGLDYAGVDIARDRQGKPTLLEVNSNAFFKGVESVSQVNVARAFVAHCLKEVKKRG